jgi:hypothetical protein
LYLVTPSGGLNVDGAALNNPERAVLSKPAPGQWLALVDGFDLPTGTDKFELRVSLDGKVVKQPRSNMYTGCSTHYCVAPALVLGGRKYLLVRGYFVGRASPA